MISSRSSSNSEEDASESLQPTTEYDSVLFSYGKVCNERYDTIPSRVLEWYRINCTKIIWYVIAYGLSI